VSDYQDILDEPDEESETEVAEATAEAPAAETEIPAGEGRTGGEPAPDAAPQGDAPPAPAAGLPEGYKLDALGRVHGPDGRVVSKEEAEKIKAQAVPVVPSTPVEPTPVVPPTPEPVAPPAPESFTFRANGQRMSLPIVVPPEHHAKVRELLASGAAWPAQRAQYEQRIKQAETAGSARSEKYNRASIFLLDKVEQLLAENPAELGMVRREIALMLKEADLTIPPAATASDDGPSEDDAKATIAGSLRELYEDTPEAKVLSEKDRAEILQAITDDLNAYFTEHEGEIVLDFYKLRARFTRELTSYQRAAQARDDASRAAEAKRTAAAFNAANAPKPTAPTPKPIAPKPVVTTAPSGQRPGWDKSFDAVWKNTDDE
jgi:hypothetical protein